MTNVLEIDDREYQAWLSRHLDGYRLHLDGVSIAVAQIASRRQGMVILTIDGERHPAFVAIDGDRIHVQVGGITRTVTFQDPVRRLQQTSGAAAADIVMAPMPGTVVAHYVKVGDKVEMDQTLIVIESMKLETTIKAWRDGVVTEIPYSKGDQFERTAPLIVLAPISTEGH